MRLGLLTAPFPETPLVEVADWTAANGFESLEIACWPRADRPDPALRRHLPHRRREPVGRARPATSRAEIEGKGLTISGLGYYPNPLHPDPEHRAEVIGHLKHVIDGRREDGRPARQHVHGRATARRTRTTTGTRRSGSGRTSSRSRSDHGRKITIENCPMLFSYDEWPGGHNIATTPRIWRRILEQWGGTIGLNFDPSHLILQMIDIPRFIREFGPHILHVQAKDLMIDRDGLYERGDLLDGHRLAGPAPARPRRRRLGPSVRARCTARATTAT